MDSRLASIAHEMAILMRPPMRVSVSELAKQHLMVSNTMLWDADITPYMIRPMDETASRLHDCVCFVGPARTGKTQALILGRMLYAVLAHPQDFAIIHSSQDLARDFAHRDVVRLHNRSALMREALTTNSHEQNTFDKAYKSGIMGILGWPSATQLASRTLPLMLLTDYGRWDADIGREGSGFAQARKRTQTAGSLAMTVVESSPGEKLAPSSDVDMKKKWKLGKPISHEFPAIAPDYRASICEIYNNGTKEWWYVPCKACGEYYPQNPDIERFSWPVGAPQNQIVREAGTVCPWCGTVHPEETKRWENSNGVWLAEGEVIDCNGKVTGESLKGHTYPSFALGGGAAAYQKRGAIVQKYLQALKIASDTGGEENLKAVINGDVGAPYREISDLSDTTDYSEAFMRREVIPKRQVSADVRFLVVAVDVQVNRFVVQVIGFGPNRNRWLVDRFNLRHTDRGDNTCSPAVFEEDWDLLNGLLTKKYQIIGADGFAMMPAMMVCDSAGVAGVTERAYQYYRHLPRSVQARFRLIKGVATSAAPIVQQRIPDTSQRANRGKSRGDVPVLFVHSDRMKDRIHSDLRREEEGPGKIHFPDWLGEWFFREIYREVRDEKGRWGLRNVRAGGNEALDLFCYAEAAAMMGVPFSIKPRGIDHPDFWKHPPDWASEDFNKNPFILDKEASEAEYTIKPSVTKPAFNAIPQQRPRRGLWN